VLDGPEARLLARLGAGWSPPPFFLPPVVTLLLNEEDFTRQLLSIMLVGSELELRVRGREAAQLNRTLQTVVAYTSGGGQVRGRVSSTATQVQGSERDIATELLVVCDSWSYTPVSPPLLWVARLAGLAKLPGPGNLRIEWKRRTRIVRLHSSLRLERPGLTSFFVATTEHSPAGDVWLCLDSRRSPSGLEELSADLQLFRLVLSTPIQPGIFYGLDAEGQTVAAHVAPDESAARAVSVGLQAPVPVRTQQLPQGRLVWAAPFYERLAAAYLRHQTANPVAYSLERYAHTLAPLDVDTEFLLVGGAISVLIRHLVEGPGRAATGEMGLAFSQDVGKAVQLPVHQVILPDLEAEYVLLLQVDPDVGLQVANELLQARLVFEQGILSGPNGSPAPLSERYDRVQRLRRAYAVLLARAIDYQGAISEFPPLYTEQATGRLHAPKPRAETTRAARQRYHIQADLGGLANWPQFHLEPLPENALVRRFLTFADELRQTTQGRVIARLRPLPRRNDEPYRLSFRLLVQNAPVTQVALFTVEITATGLLVRGWSDQPRLLPTEAALLQFEQELVFSEKLRYEMQRLLLIEEDRQRGEA
jgi:hypothetical protein